jgi:intracellular multiplication protein IcmF
MDKSLDILCNAIKKIIIQLKPQHHELSFVILTGKEAQGKSTLLRQSHFQHLSVDSECPVDIYYNPQGLIVELSEAWVNQSKHLLQYTLKRLNRCHRSLKITGLLLCVDIQELFIAEPAQFAEQTKIHVQLLTRFGQGLGYRVNTAILFTKLDALAGFCEFFQNDHASELKKPLGFSLDWSLRQGKLFSNYKNQFEQLIEVLGQQVIQKMHPVRSSLKRTLIREFPLQLASLGRAIQLLIQSISPQLFRLQALYFTSGEQGGMSIDRLNKKIEREYALVVQDQFPQAVNHRAYFIEGPLASFQKITKSQHQATLFPQKWALASVLSVVAVSVAWISVNHLQSTHMLDKASQELLAYDTLIGQPQGDVASAVYHLNKAGSTLDKLTSHALYLPTIRQLQSELHAQTKQHLHGNFLPTVLAEIEQHLVDSKANQVERYQALKIYLMLGDPSKYSANDVMTWFREHWQQGSKETSEEKLSLLKQILRQPFQALPINHQIVSDVRNYLNALPPSYLYYTLAKMSFPDEKQTLVMDGFELADSAIPVYFTKLGFQPTIEQLASISQQLQSENWVLARQDLQNLPLLLQQAYCYQYTLWWQNFMHKSTPLHFQNYQQARQLTSALNQSNAMNKLVDFIQQQTSPELGAHAELFNKEVASKFTDLSLMSHSAVEQLNMYLAELEKFMTTLSVVQDEGRTAFAVTKARFEGDNLSNPLSALYAQARQLPEPVGKWAQQIADDAWFILISESRNYINQQWQQTVINDYKASIAHRYPLDTSQNQDVALSDFDRFFSPQGVLSQFVNLYLKPFLDTQQAQWQAKEVNHYVLPISQETINELIRANVITNMFFPNESASSRIDFSLQKISLDPVVARLQFVLGDTELNDNQDSESLTHFHWPQSNAKLSLQSIEGQHYELDELGPWAFFKILQKLNVLVDDEDSANLEILFEVNGNSGRYILKTQNKVNPFIPGILNGFTLNESIA